MKPGIKTTEFWLTLITLLGMMGLAGLALSQKNSDASAIIAALGAALSTIGYSVARAKVKNTTTSTSDTKESGE